MTRRHKLPPNFPASLLFGHDYDILISQPITPTQTLVETQQRLQNQPIPTDTIDHMLQDCSCSFDVVEDRHPGISLKISQLSGTYAVNIHRRKIEPLLSLATKK